MVLLYIYGKKEGMIFNYVIFLWVCIGKVNIKMYILIFVFFMSLEVIELYFWGNLGCEFYFVDNKIFCILKYFKEFCIVWVFMRFFVVLIFWWVLWCCILDVIFVKF